MATGSRVTFMIADKTFDVAIDDGEVTIVERWDGRHSEVKICTEAAVWLSNLLTKYTVDKKKKSFLGRNEFGDLTVAANKKRNPTGTVLSIMFFDYNWMRGPTYICVPGEDADGSGWVRFASQIVNPTNPAHNPTIRVEASREDGAGSVESFRERGVVVSSDSDKIPWERVPATIDSIFRVSGAPSLMRIGHNRYVMGMRDERDFKIVLCAPRLHLSEGIIRMKRWIPDRNNPVESCLSKHDRWVELEGVPAHLRDPVILGKMCSAFGSSVSRIDLTYVSSVVVVGALVLNCDLFLMPHVAVLDDRGVKYPVKLTLPEDAAVTGNRESYSKVV